MPNIACTCGEIYEPRRWVAFEGPEICGHCGATLPESEESRAARASSPSRTVFIDVEPVQKRDVKPVLIGSLLVGGVILTLVQILTR